MVDKTVVTNLAAWWKDTKGSDGSGLIQRQGTWGRKETLEIDGYKDTPCFVDVCDSH